MPRSVTIVGSVLAIGALFLLVGGDSAVGPAEAAPTPQPTVEHITDNPAAPYSPVVRVGNMLYLSGKLGVSRSEENGIQPETRRCRKP